MTRFEYQLDILKIEIETVNASIRQMDKMGESIKNWAILIWAAAERGPNNAKFRLED